MNKPTLITIFIMTLMSLYNANVYAADYIDLPEEELAQESVTPIFDRRVAVRGRNVMTDGRWDMNLFYGAALTEPIFNVSRLGLSLYYNTSENNSFGLMYLKNSTGLSVYADQLASPGITLDFSRAPGPESSLLADWNAKLYYGKMSFTKHGVLNMGIHTSVLAGMVNYVHKSYVGIGLGIGQKFWFTDSLALRMDLRMMTHQAPIPFLEGKMKTSDLPKPSYSEFSERMTFTIVLDAGLTYLF